MSPHHTSDDPIRVGMISLGCAKNLVDAEIMLGTLLKDGVEVVNAAEEADVVIINTCSFIDSAQEESVDAILESDELREARHRGQGLIVSGCLPQRFRNELPKLLPEVDAFMGVDEVARVTDIVRQAQARRTGRLGGASDKEGLPGTAGACPAQPRAKQGGKATKPAPILEVSARPKYMPDFATPRFRLTPRHFAYVKIAEGCNHPCSFCIIPRMRGAHRSRAQADIVQEVRQLVAEGVKEINLISQDSTYYGLDLREGHRPTIASPGRFKAAVADLAVGASTLSTLLRELNALEGEFWIRILYTHPAHWTDDLITTIAECPKVARYVDIPLQHIHENMLQRMRRETSRAHIEDLLRRIRSGVPGIALRTTFIVGFPGETARTFGELLDFIRRTRFERLGVFAYSKEDGTLAGRMAGQVSAKVKEKRREEAMAVQHEVAVSVAESFVGKTIKVLVEGEATAKQIKAAKVDSWEHGLIRDVDKASTRLRGRYLVGRGEADAPDIDGRVFIRGDVPMGEFARVRIVGHTDYDLLAEPA